MSSVSGGRGVESAPLFARRLAHQLTQVCDPMAVLLFGSWAKGTANLHSDVDLVVVLPQRPTPAVRAALCDAVLTVPLKVDLLIWTTEDVMAARADPPGFAGSILSDYILLHGALPFDERRG
jgi:predicted nucleotidyltransferase